MKQQENTCNKSHNLLIKRLTFKDILCLDNCDILYVYSDDITIDLAIKHGCRLCKLSEKDYYILKGDVTSEIQL